MSSPFLLNKCILPKYGFAPQAMSLKLRQNEAVEKETRFELVPVLKKSL
jgi:hypothetical protein